MISGDINIDNTKIGYLKSNGAKFTIVDEFFDNEFIKKCEEEFKSIPENEFVRYQNPLFEYEKYAMNDKEKMPENLKKLFEFIHSAEFISIVSQITDMTELMVDENRWGGGLHMTKKGGYLSVHKDFNVLPTTYIDDRQMLRCINLIGYLNSEWKEGDGGELEFWDDSGKMAIQKIEPKFNRWVIFDTRNNYHGHPYPYRGETPRISIASYYYIRTITSDADWASTEYLKLPWMDDSDEYRKARRERADAKTRYKNIQSK